MTSLDLRWVLIMPMTVSLLAVLLQQVRRIKGIPAALNPWLRLGALALVCAGLLVEAALISLAPDGALPAVLGIPLASSVPSRYVLTGANVALACGLVAGWLAPLTIERRKAAEQWMLLSTGGLSTLLGGAALSTSIYASALMLLGAILIVAALTLTVYVLAAPATLTTVAGQAPAHGGDADEPDEEDEASAGRAMAGTLKQVALAVLATCLWVAAAALIESYGFNLENRGLLQFGVAMLAAGLLLWAGVMPFSASWIDLVRSASAAAVPLLGACTPVALVAGLLLLAPVEGSLARGAAAGWLGAVAALLAGIRAFAAASTPTKGISGESPGLPGTIKAMTVAVAAAWALYGTLSGSAMGAVGAVLLASNIALAVPLLLAGGRWANAVGAAALLGLPPFGGFGGAMLVAQSATNAGGGLLAMLLIGAALVGSAWLIFAARTRAAAPPAPGQVRLVWRSVLLDPVSLVMLALVIAQVALFFLSAYRLDPLLRWATVPWLSAP